MLAPTSVASPAAAAGSARAAVLVEKAFVERALVETGLRVASTRSLRARGFDRRPAAASRSSWASAEAEGRRAGSGASARSIAASSRFGRSGRSSWSGGAPVSIAAAICWSGVPQKGCLPESDSQSRIPTPQTSLAGRASSPRSRSGEM